MGHGLEAPVSGDGTDDKEERENWGEERGAKEKQSSRVSAGG
jgi:hypothetical protein